MQPYVKQDWEDLVTIINKSRLSQIEEGIYRISLVQPEKGEAGKDGITPQFRVANGYIQVSVDSGNTKKITTKTNNANIISFLSI